MPRRKTPGFIWIPREKNTKYSIEIDGVDVTTEVINSEWTRSIIGLECPCKLTLIDTEGKYAELYTGGEVIELFLDFGDGTTSQWKGKLDQPKRKFGDAYFMELVGSHFQSDLLDITVTESYDGSKTADTVYKELVDTYLTGHTYTNVTSSSTLITIKWDNKPLWDCISDLCGLAGYDAYLDSDKDHHFFEQESIKNTVEALVWNDNMLEIIEFGNDTVDVKNRIIVYGEDDTGLPVIYQTDDTTSQSTYGIKEQVIKDTSIKTYDEAKSIGDTELASQKDTANKGEILSIILPDIYPGDMIWITNPVQQINDQFRIVKYTHKLPIEQTTVIIAREKTIPQLFKDRKKSELQLQKITNPNKMTNSYNFPFNDYNYIDTTLSSSITIASGNLKVSTGSVGTMISEKRDTSTAVTYVHLSVIGDALSGTTYEISTDDGDTYETVELETLTAVTEGSALRVKVTLNSASTLIDSLGVYYK